MPNGERARSRYLAEWYTPRLSVQRIGDIAERLRRTLAAMPGEPNAPQLLYAVEVPRDAYAFGVFAADSPEVVLHACQQAGLPADRVTAAVEAL
ncbi:hypothetical protein MSAS_18720 [Mycobacterium saskatchewanense]|uniref:DUF4242 domain-containing protein n=1 Tax=Mycobacterium saskatchewanense TaxID=220927 RepID=A0AAJ3NPW7_9MYCO|nr:hypothetical protein [Mycobacterium saskatchewanense]ORW71127.1 hypothetical protein AWC23_01020 [Mycobacterium saskatchewanense]BBX62698.1 hypothetical protein MSAS_18720 [Mycobacterium saskatchewanense]